MTATIRRGWAVWAFTGVARVTAPHWTWSSPTAEAGGPKPPSVSVSNPASTHGHLAQMEESLPREVGGSEVQFLGVDP